MAEGTIQPAPPVSATDSPPTLPWAVALVRRFVGVYLYLWHRFRRGACTIPDHGPVIVVANHVSGLDPLALVVSSPHRLIRFMMASELYQQRPLYWIYRQLGVIPVDRARADVSSVRAALRALQAGAVVGLFPEGRISMTGVLQDARPGAASLALSSGATIVPAYISGVHAHEQLIKDYLAPARLRVRYGPPLDLSAYHGQRRSKALIEEVTARIIAAIMRVRDEPADET